MQVSDEPLVELLDKEFGILLVKGAIASISMVVVCDYIEVKKKQKKIQKKLEEMKEKTQKRNEIEISLKYKEECEGHVILEEEKR